MRRAIGLLLLPLISCYAQLAPGPDVTTAMTNGRFWLKLDANSKAGFIVGSRDAAWLGTLTLGLSDPEKYRDYTKTPDQLKWPDLTTQEVVKELDMFYSEGANGPIPIVLAIGYVRHKATGDTPDQLQQLLARLRRLATEK